VSRANADAFRAALARFASGVTVVTARDAAGADHGMTVSAFSSLSLDPPLVLVCLDLSATALPALRDADCFGISILADDQQAVSLRFAQQGIVRFDGVPTTRAPQGPLLISGAAAHLVCRRVAEHPGGDHVILVGEVQRAEVHGDAPLVYAMRRYGRFAADT
jgi:flavin reductase (DIM6/NTAB) family NADH-FMN oxidoreductase RutF